MFEALMQFGVAGLMGVLWIWERTHSRSRERQLSEAHRLLSRRDQYLNLLIKLVRQNTRTVVGFEQTLKQMCKLLEEIGNEISRHDRAA